MKNNVSKVSCLSMQWLRLLLSLLPFVILIASCSSIPPAGSLVDDHLRPCPDRPNCYNSEQQGERYTEPIILTGNIDQQWNAVPQLVSAMGGDIEMSNEHYLWATFTSPIFRFVDDLELRLDRETSTIHLRSGSRVGFSDLGVNGKRIEELRSYF